MPRTEITPRVDAALTLPIRLYIIAAIANFVTYVAVVGAEMADVRTPDVMAGAGWLSTLFAFAAFLIFVIAMHRAWVLVPRPYRMFTPALATILLFIPLINIVWMFFAFGGLARSVRKWGAGQGVDASRAVIAAVVLAAVLFVSIFVFRRGWPAFISLPLIHIATISYLLNLRAAMSECIEGG